MSNTEIKISFESIEVGEIYYLKDVGFYWLVKSKDKNFIYGRYSYTESFINQYGEPEESFIFKIDDIKIGYNNILNASKSSFNPEDSNWFSKQFISGKATIVTKISQEKIEEFKRKEKEFEIENDVKFETMS